MTDLDLDSIRRRHDEDHEHDGGCDTLDLLAEVERLRAAATHEVAAHETQVARLTTRIEKAEAEALRWKAAYEMAEPVPSERDRLRAELDAAQEARDINLRGLAEFAAQLTEQRERANKAESELAAHQDAVEAVRALADRDDLTYWRTDDPMSGRGVALRSRKAVADMIRAALDEHLGGER